MQPEVATPVGATGRPICLQKWPNLIANLGSKLAKSLVESGPHEEARNVAGNGHFNAMVSFEMTSRQQCLISHDLPRNFGEIPALRWRPKMLQKGGHFSSRVAPKMGPRQKCQIPRDSPKKCWASWSVHLSRKMAQFDS